MCNRHAHRQVSGRTDIFSGPLQPVCPAPPAPISGERVKKGPQNRISEVNGKAAAGGTNQPMTDPPVSITRCAQPGMPSPGCPAAGGGATVARTFAVPATVPPSRYPPGGRPSPRADPSWRGGYRLVSTRRLGPGVKPGAPGDLTGRPEWRVDACGPGRQASPPRRPAPGPAASTPATAGPRRRSPPGTPRPPLPAFPSGRAGPPASPRPAAQRVRRTFPLFPVPRPGSPGPRPAVAGPAGAGLDAAGGAERPSSRTHGRAAPGNANRSRSAPCHPGGRTRKPGRPAADDR